MSIDPGKVYIAHRHEIINPKLKYHLFLASDIVFLINSKKSLYEFSLPLSENDCSILTKDCYLQLSNLYRYDEKQKIIDISDLSSEALTRLCNYLKDKTIKKAIPKIFVDRAIGIIEQCLSERKKSVDILNK